MRRRFLSIEHPLRPKFPPRHLGAPKLHLGVAGCINCFRYMEIAFNLRICICRSSNHPGYIPRMPLAGDGLFIGNLYDIPKVLDLLSCSPDFCICKMKLRPSWWNKYVLSFPLCFTLWSNNHDLPNNRCVTVIGVTSQGIWSLYLPRDKKTWHWSRTMNWSQSYIYANCYSASFRSIFKFNFSTISIIQNFPCCLHWLPSYKVSFCTWLWLWRCYFFSNPIR